MKKLLCFLLIIATFLGTTIKVDATTRVQKETTYIKSLYFVHGKLYGKFDYIQWYFGKDADREFLKDCPECKKQGMTSPPDMYYIRNVNKRIRTIQISSKAQYILQTRGDDIKWNEKVNQKHFLEFTKKKGVPYSLPFHIELKNGVITKITEQYVP